MTKRIFRNILAVAVCMFVLSAVLFMTVLYGQFSSSLKSQLRDQLDFISNGVLNEGVGYFDGIDSDKYRITWIGKDGNVLYDSTSDIREMENHFEREEVKKALKDGYGESSRYSSTLTKRYLYSAKRLSDGTVLRLSVTQNSLFVLTLGMLQPICVIFAVIIILSIILAYRLSKKIIKPLNELNLEEPLSNEGYDELDTLLKKMDMQQRQIRNQRNQLKQRQNEFETLIKGMSEGIVLADSKGFILSINPSAGRVMSLSGNINVGENILSLNCIPEVSDAFNEILNGSRCEKNVKINNGIYRISAYPIREESKIQGVAILLLDITEKEKSEEIRREFTANVSHELKTPLQVVAGCAELLDKGLVKSEDVPDFIKKINAETNRMIQLVNDIIKLSHLDECNNGMAWENVDIMDIVEKVSSSLKPVADEAGVEIKIEGEHIVIYGIAQLIDGIVYNLCDNAIKYNRKGGDVCVSVEEKSEYVLLSVADTGIGISAEDTERIFERFYRVDKSRSKNSGGTGLGLSIVKHSARLLGADIAVNSTLGKGTVITVKFKRQLQV